MHEITSYIWQYIFLENAGNIIRNFCTLEIIYTYLLLYYQIFTWIASSAQRGEMINELWKSCGSCESYFSVLDKQKGTFAPAMEFFTKKRQMIFVYYYSLNNL